MFSHTDTFFHYRNTFNTIFKQSHDINKWENLCVNLPYPLRMRIESCDNYQGMLSRDLPVYRMDGCCYQETVYVSSG